MKPLAAFEHITRAHIRGQQLHIETKRCMMTKCETYTWSIRQKEVQFKRSFAGQNQLYVQSHKWVESRC